MDLEIYELDGDRLSWRLDGLDGECFVEDGVALSAYLLEDRHIQLKPGVVIKIIHEANKWLKEKPERDRNHDEWEARRITIDAAWDTWHCDNPDKVVRAMESVDNLPDEIAIKGSAWVFYTGEHGVYYDKVKDPTWADLLIHFDKAIRVTAAGHCFFEGIVLESESRHILPEELKGKRLPIYAFCSGS
jgi:hypothetical protein